MKQFNTTLKAVIEAGEDFEWYPTTNEILSCITNHAKRLSDVSSVLDIGAGNGKALSYFTQELEPRPRENGSNKVFYKAYAIEKSQPLLAAMPKEIFIIGADFKEQTLFDKEIDVTFCNPPYSEFVQWSARIIAESVSPYIYLVIPERWKDSEPITAALQLRKAQAKTIGSFSFADAEDRKARAKVDVVFINLSAGGYNRKATKTDPFKQFFETEFSDLCDKFKDGLHGNLDEENPKISEIVRREDFIKCLVELYRQELNKIQDDYKKISTLDPVIFKEFNISPDSICENLKGKFKTLKKQYWKHVFDNLDNVTDKLTVDSREKILATLFSNSNVDFTAGNVYSVVLWVIKNANDYFDSQLVETYEGIISKANVVNYKSNQRVFKDDSWRYNQSDHPENSHFKLDYRIVVEHSGGILVSDWNCWRKEEFNGLTKRAFNFLSDLATIAQNLGFQKADSPKNFDWMSGSKGEFTYIDQDGSTKALFEAKAFQNQNIHIRFSQEFALALNVEFGRLKGWIANGTEAAEEMEDPNAVQYFHSNHKLALSQSGQLLPDHSSVRTPVKTKTKPASKVKASQKRAKEKSFMQMIMTRDFEAAFKVGTESGEIKDLNFDKWKGEIERRLKQVNQLELFAV